MSEKVKEKRPWVLLCAAQVTLALASFGIGAVVVTPGAGAASAVPRSMAPVTLKGTLVKVESASSFEINVGASFVLVKVDDMTHISLGTKHVKLSSLQVGDSLVVRGHQETGFVSATSVVAEMGMGLVKFTGKLVKIDSRSSFTVAVAMIRELVKTDAMTHMKVKVSSLRVGDRLSVTGRQEMGFVSATSVVVHM